MRIITLIFFSLIVIFLLSEVSEMNTEMSFSEISELTKIPLKKLLNNLDLKYEIDIKSPVKEFGINSEKLNTAIQKYETNRKKFYTGIVLVGMIIVFTSLVAIGFIIAQLRHLHFFENLKKNKVNRIKYNPLSGKIITHEDLNNNTIIAAITTLFLHEIEVEEHNSLHLTWKRTQISQWKLSGRAIKPNSQYFNSQRR